MQQDRVRVKLTFLPMFYEDMSEIIDYIALILKNPDAADRIVDEVFEAIDKRLPIADRFEKYESTHEFHYDYYKINVKNFTVFYVVKNNSPFEKVMEVRRILYNRRDLKNII